MSKIQFTHVSKLKVRSEPQYLVEGLIPASDITVVWGKPKSGKTFWVLDLALHVATGKAYRKRPTQLGNVAYCALEGGTAFPNRLEAVRRAATLDIDKAGFWLSIDRFTFLKAWGAASLIHAIETTLPEPPKLVVIDTLNRSLSGSENTDVDMTEYTKCIEDIGSKFNCSVIVVHHCGVSGDKPRGHTSLTGTCAAQLRIAKVGRAADPDQPAMISATIEFMKDGQEGQQIFSWLQPVTLGINKIGQEITSCYIEEAPVPASQRHQGSRAPGHAEKALAILQAAITESGEERITVSEWRERCRLAKMGRTKEASKKAFYRAMEKLQEEGVITIEEQWAYLSNSKENGHDNTRELSGTGREDHII